MLAGVFFVPFIMLVYQRFIAVKTGLAAKEFFIIFSVVYILFFVFFSALGEAASVALRKKMKAEFPRDVTIVAPAAAGSNDPETIKLGKKYWFWQLVNGYFAGIAISWIICIFILFVT